MTKSWHRKMVSIPAVENLSYPVNAEFNGYDRL
jgi:hypothetical protein